MKKRFIIVLSVILVMAIASIGYSIFFVHFEDPQMGRLLAQKVGKANRMLVTKSDLDRIESIEIGPTCNYDTIIDLAKCKNLKELHITDLWYDKNSYFETLDVIGLLKRNSGEYEYSSFKCDIERSRVEHIQEDLREVFLQCKDIEVFRVGGIRIPEMRDVHGYDCERTPIQFTNVDFLKTANNLKEIRLPHQKNIEDYSCIFTLDSLENVWLNDTNISNINFSTDNNISCLNISNTDISVEELGNLGKLKKIVISPDQTNVSEYIPEDTYVLIMVSDTKEYLDKFGTGIYDGKNVIVSIDDVELQKEISIQQIRDIFLSRESLIEINIENKYSFCLSRSFNEEVFKCLYDAVTGKVMAVHIYGDNDITVSGLKIGDSIEKVCSTFGPADGYGTLFDNGILYECEGFDLVIYFNDEGLNITAFEIYYDESVFGLKDVSLEEAYQYVYYDE